MRMARFPHVEDAVNVTVSASANTSHSVATATFHDILVPGNHSLHVMITDYVPIINDTLGENKHDIQSAIPTLVLELPRIFQ